MRDIVLSILLISASLSGLGMTLWRFDWLQKHVPFLLNWGGGLAPRFRASKIGVAAGCIVGILLGALILYAQFEEPSHGLLITVLCVMFLVVIPAAMHDFILHRRSKGRSSAAANGASRRRRADAD